MSIHTLPPGAFTPERIEEIARLGQIDPHVRGYRSFHSLAEGRIVWMLNAPNKEAVEDWCRRVGLPLDGVTALEMEGFVGTIRPVRTAIPNQLSATVESLVRDGIVVLATLRLTGGAGNVVALLDTDECDAMGLSVGSSALALIKATNVSVEMARKENDTMKLSFPNQIKGRVTNIISSSTLVIVYIDTPGGQVVSAMIPSAAEQIELKVGDEVTALFKALDVSLGKA